MKKLFTPLLLFFCFSISAQSIKVIGYLPTYHWDKLGILDYQHLTHVCASFVNPDEEGNLSFEKDLNEFVSVVKSHSTIPLISIGGGGDYSWGDKYKIYEKLIATPTSRTKFIQKLMNYVRKYDLAGIDNDMEGMALELKNYNVFARELADSLHAEGMLFTAALGVGGQWGVDLLEDSTMHKYDFIMTMSYGGVGNWNIDTKPDRGTYALSLIHI